MLFRYLYEVCHLFYPPKVSFRTPHIPICHLDFSSAHIYTVCREGTSFHLANAFSIHLVLWTNDWWYVMKNRTDITLQISVYVDIRVGQHANLDCSSAQSVEVPLIGMACILWDMPPVLYFTDPLHIQWTNCHEIYRAI